MPRALDSPRFVLSAEVQRGRGHPFSLPALRNVDSIRLDHAVTFFVGENGSGKSTIIEAIALAAGFNVEGGSKNFQFETVRREEEHPRLLHLFRTPRRASDGYFLRAESFFNVATEIDRLEVTRGYGGRSLHEQSHGEAFLALLTHRLQGDGLYVFDEPEAALSPMRQLTLLARMHELVHLGSQFIIATHSPIVMAYPGATIYHVSEDGLRTIAYEETEHYLVTRDFLNRRERMLRELMK